MTWNVTPGVSGHDGPVNVEVDELFWQGNEYLIAATHGRGMFRARPRVSLHVNVASPGPGDGTPGNPYRLIQDALNVQAHGTPIFITTGTYQQGGVIFNRRCQLIPQNGPVVIQ